MSIWNKVLLGLIIVASLGFFYLAAVVLKTHQYWRESARDHEQRVEALASENEKFREEGLPGGPGGLRDLDFQLHSALIGRGRVWYDCTPQKANEQTGAVSVATSRPDPHGINPQTILYVFEQRQVFSQEKVEPQGQFLGEFRVAEVAGKLVALEPSMRMLPHEAQRLAQSRGPWTLRERLPSDRRDMFAGRDQKELARILPAKAVDEFVNAGAQRKLRDYRLLLKSFDRQRTEMIERLERAQRHLLAVNSSVEDVRALVKFRHVERTALEAELALVQRERKEALAYQKKLEAEIAQRKTTIDALMAKSRAVVGEMTKLQAEATRHINEQTSVVRQ